MLGALYYMVRVLLQLSRDPCPIGEDAKSDHQDFKLISGMKSGFKRKYCYYEF